MLRHAYEARHNLDRMTDTLFWPLLDVVVWGFFSLYLSQTGRIKLSSVDALLAGIILWGVFRAFQRDIALGFLAEIWSRNVVNLFASPLSLNEYFAGLLAVNIAKVVVGGAVAVALAVAGYRSDLLRDLPALLPALAVLILFAVSIGIIVSGLILRYTSRVQTLAYSLTGLLMPLSCVFYPRSALPQPLRGIAAALPSTHAFEDMRQVLAGGGSSAEHLGWGFALAGVSLAVSVSVFRAIFRTARRRGHLVRLD